MKRILALCALLVMISMVLGGCAANATSAPAVSLEGKEVVEIREKMFLAQLNDIFLNADDYLGKVIKYQGMYSEGAYGEKQDIFRCVYRNSPGCCGADGQVGFEITWDQQPPQNNDWVEVTGVLERYEEDGAQYLRVQAATLTVLAERGAEFVSQ